LEEIFNFEFEMIKMLKLNFQYQDQEEVLVSLFD